MLRRIPLFSFIFLTLVGVFAWDSDTPPKLGSGGEIPAATLQTVKIGIRPGRWEGSMEFRQAGSGSGGGGGTLFPGVGTVPVAAPGPLVLRLLDGKSGGLLDMPEQSMYGFPLSSLTWREDRISFTVDTGAEASSLKFTGFTARTASGASPRIVGTFRGAGLEGSFSLVLVPDRLMPGESRVSIDTGMGVIPGSLIIPPDSTGTVPLVILISASGTTDRDGNNFNIPGKNDAFRQIASTLADEGVASYRFDKRGSGEAYRLVYDENFLRFYQYVNDAAEVIRFFHGDERFSRVIVVCHAEGALVGAAALNSLDASDSLIDGLMLVCASGKSPAQGVEESLRGTPDELKAEAAAIMKALREGREYPEPSEYFADFFRSSFQAYLSSWFAYDAAVEIGSVMVPVILVHGGRDLQIPLTEFDILARLRPSASAYLLPGMNHALKEVSGDQDENFSAFTNPDMPLGKGLVPLITAFAKVRPVPSQIIRYRPPEVPAVSAIK